MLWETGFSTQHLLEDIFFRCNACQWFGRWPILFKVSLPSKGNNNSQEELCFINTMFFEGIQVIHVVDMETRDSKVSFQHINDPTYDPSVIRVWLPLLSTWSLAYSGYPKRLQTGQGYVFISDCWIHLTALSGIQLCCSGVEAWNPL